jgi:glycerol kinase
MKENVYLTAIDAGITGERTVIFDTQGKIVTLHIYAEETSLDKGMPVICDDGNQHCGAIGVGIATPSRIKATTGTRIFIIYFLDKPSLDPKRKVLCSCHRVPGKWVQKASMFSIGTIYRWFRDRFGHLEKIVEQYKPISENKEIYDKLFEFKKIYRALEKTGGLRRLGESGLITLGAGNEGGCSDCWRGNSGLHHSSGTVQI